MSQPRPSYVITANDVVLPIFLQLYSWRYGETSYDLRQNPMIWLTSLAGGPHKEPFMHMEFSLRSNEIHFRNLQKLSYFPMTEGFLLGLSWIPENVPWTFSHNLIFHTAKSEQPQKAIMSSRAGDQKVARLASRGWTHLIQEPEESMSDVIPPFDVTLLLSGQATHFEMDHPGEMALRREDQLTTDDE